MSEITLRPEKHIEKNGAIRIAKNIYIYKLNHSEEELGIEEGVRKEKKRKNYLKERYRRGGGGWGEKHLEQLGEP